MPKLTKGQALTLNESELNKLLSYIDKAPHAKRNRLLILMSFYCGLRAVELAALMIRDVYRNGQVIESVPLRRTKGGKPGIMYLTNATVIKALEEYIQERNPQPNEPLFISQKGAFTNLTLQKHFEYLYKKYGFIGASSHSGRRTFATRLNQSGLDIKTISVLMRHQNIATTARYIDNDPETLKSVMSNI